MKKLVGVKLDEEIVKQIEEEGQKSEVIKKALASYFKGKRSVKQEGSDVKPIVTQIQETLQQVLENQKQLLEALEDVKRFQPVINLNYPQKSLPQISRSGSEVSIAPAKKWWQFWR
jgi:D-serine dehydratase